MGGEYERETSRPLRTAGFSCASSPPYRAAFSRGELAALRALFTDDAEVYSTEALPNAGRFKGREGELEWVGAWLDAWEDCTGEPLEYETIGDGGRSAVSARAAGGATAAYRSR